MGSRLTVASPPAETVNCPLAEVALVSDRASEKLG